MWIIKAQYALIVEYNKEKYRQFVNRDYLSENELPPEIPNHDADVLKYPPVFSQLRLRAFVFLLYFLSAPSFFPLGAAGVWALELSSGWNAAPALTGLARQQTHSQAFKSRVVNRLKGYSTWSQISKFQDHKIWFCTLCDDKCLCLSSLWGIYSCNDNKCVNDVYYVIKQAYLRVRRKICSMSSEIFILSSSVALCSWCVCEHIVSYFTVKGI